VKLPVLIFLALSALTGCASTSESVRAEETNRLTAAISKHIKSDCRIARVRNDGVSRRGHHPGIERDAYGKSISIERRHWIVECKSGEIFGVEEPIDDFRGPVIYRCFNQATAFDEGCHFLPDFRHVEKE
jgi:hypothetical protein